MDPITAASASLEPAADKPQRPRRRWLVLSILCFALSAYSVAAALWGTTENAFITPADQLLWIALPLGVLGALFITLHVLARRVR
jgi:hypothetical protein